MNEWMTGLSKTQLSSCTEAHVIPCTQYNNNVVDCLAPLLVTTTCIYSLALYSFSWYSKQWCVLNYYTAVILTTMALQLVTISLSKTQLSTNSLQYTAVPCRNHSVVYFELIVAYKVLYQWTSAMGGAHMLFLTVPIIQCFLYHVHEGCTNNDSKDMNIVDVMCHCMSSNHILLLRPDVQHMGLFNNNYIQWSASTLLVP